MPLYQRLLLALVPPLYWLVLFYILALEIPSLVGYGALFALCVMVPFIAASTRIWLRATILAFAFFGSACVFIMFAISQMFDNIYLLFSIGLSASTLIIGVALATTAPLETSNRFWLLLLISGVVTGISAAYWFEEYAMSCFFQNCPDWYEWMLFVPAAIWPVTFCLAVYYGRHESTPTC